MNRPPATPTTSTSPKRVVVLGSTGSVGTSTLDVAAALPERISIVGLMAHSRWKELAEQCRRFKPAVAILTDRTAFERMDRAAFPAETELKSFPLRGTRVQKYKFTARSALRIGRSGGWFRGLI